MRWTQEERWLRRCNCRISGADRLLAFSSPTDIEYASMCASTQRTITILAARATGLTPKRRKESLSRNLFEWRPCQPTHQRVTNAGLHRTDVVTHERREHCHRSLILGSHKLRINDQFSTGVFFRNRQLNSQAQFTFRQLTRTNIEMRSVILTDFITGELKTFFKLTYNETIGSVINLTDGFTQTFEHPIR